MTEYLLWYQIFSDLMPEAFFGESLDDCTETFFMKFRDWVNFQNTRLPTEQLKVDAFSHCLCNRATLWWNSVVLAANVPATLNGLKDFFFAKFRVAKTSQELRCEIRDCKYVPGVSCLHMLNKF